MIAKKLNNNERRISIAYKDIDVLLSRKDMMRKTLQNTLDSKEEQYISDEYISISEDKYFLNFILTPID